MRFLNTYILYDLFFKKPVNSCFAWEDVINVLLWQFGMRNKGMSLYAFFSDALFFSVVHYYQGIKHSAKVWVEV